MRVLFLMDQMYLHGGTERILSQKLNYLAENLNVETYLFTSEQRGYPAVYEISSKVIWQDLGINYHRELSYFHPKNLTKVWQHYCILKREIAKLKPDVIMSVSFSPEQYFLPFLAKDIPKLKEFHSSKYIYPVSTLRKFLDKSLRKYDTLVVLNETEKHFYHNSNIVVIPNFTDFQSKKHYSEIREKTIIAAGRIAPVKQFDKLVVIWSTLHREFPDWKVKIFGGGDEQLTEELNRLIKKHHLSSSVSLLPSTPHIESEMQRASIYAMTSKTECFPMVLLEAKACGLPIISFDCPTGPKHIVNDGVDGILVEADNNNAFENAMRGLLQNESQRIRFGQQAQENVGLYAKEVVMKQWFDLFSNSKKNN
jgi:glycosyltransferase involved in cell wall biosynthesis